MKVLVILTATGLAVTSTAYAYYTEALYGLEARHEFLPRGVFPRSGSGRSRKPTQPSSPKTALKNAEKEAKQVRRSHHNVLSDMFNANVENAELQKKTHYTPEEKLKSSLKIITQGEYAIMRERRRAHAYAIAADAAVKAKDEYRQIRNDRKFHSAMVRVDATTKEMQYAKLKAMSDAGKLTDAEGRQNMARLKNEYLSVNEDTSLIRNKGGRDTDSDSDSSIEDASRYLVPSVHGIGGERRRLKVIRKHGNDEMSE